jgi:hypothetical protein
VRFDVTVEPSGLIPGFVIKRAAKSVLDTATEGLRKFFEDDGGSQAG